MTQLEEMLRIMSLWEKHEASLADLAAVFPLLSNRDQNVVLERLVRNATCISQELCSFLEWVKDLGNPLSDASVRALSELMFGVDDYIGQIYIRKLWGLGIGNVDDQNVACSLAGPLMYIQVKEHNVISFIPNDCQLFKGRDFNENHSQSIRITPSLKPSGTLF